MGATLFRQTKKYTVSCNVSEFDAAYSIGTFYYREIYMGGVRGHINVTKWENYSPSEITLWMTNYDAAYTQWSHPSAAVAREMIDFYIVVRVNHYLGVRNLRRIAPVKYGNTSNGNTAYIYKIGEGNYHDHA